MYIYIYIYIYIYVYICACVCVVHMQLTINQLNVYVMYILNVNTCDLNSDCSL